MFPKLAKVFFFLAHKLYIKYFEVFQRELSKARRNCAGLWAPSVGKIFGREGPEGCVGQSGRMEAHRDLERVLMCVRACVCDGIWKVPLVVWVEPHLESPSVGWGRGQEVEGLRCGQG